MSDKKLPERSRALQPALQQALEGLAADASIPKELYPAIAEMLGYVYALDEAAEKPSGKKP